MSWLKTHKIIDNIEMFPNVVRPDTWICSVLIVIVVMSMWEGIPNFTYWLYILSDITDHNSKSSKTDYNWLA